MLVTVVRYRSITGDQESAASAVTARIEEATDLLEDELDRPLEEGDFTEALVPTRDGMLWPKATPITDGGDFTIDGLGLRSSTSFLGWPSMVGEVTPVEVSYSGGYVERTSNPDEANRLPAYIERDIAWAAHHLLHPQTPAVVPAGAESASVGDVSIDYGAGGAPAPSDSSGWWSAKTLGHRYRRIGGLFP